MRDCARGAITSLALDPRANVLLAGSLEGCLRVWSLEGRCLDKFEGLAGGAVSAAHVPQTHAWWASGRGGRVAVCDPRAPANVTAHVAQCNHLLKHQVGVFVIMQGFLAPCCRLVSYAMCLPTCLPVSSSCVHAHTNN